MKNRCINTTLNLVVGLSFLQGIAFAHGTEKHGKTSAADIQMKKLHAMMPTFSIASAELEKALEKGDLAAVEAEADRIFASIPDLKKSKPHKNINQRKKFVALATSLDETLTTTTDLAKKSDFSGAKDAFKKVEEICAACHAKFRD